MGGGLSPIQFSANVGLAPVITACHPPGGLPTEHLAPVRGTGGLWRREGVLAGGLGRGVPAQRGTATACGRLRARGAGGRL